MCNWSQTGSAEWTVLCKTQRAAPIIEVSHSHLSLFFDFVVTRECSDSDWVSSESRRGRLLKSMKSRWWTMLAAGDSVRRGWKSSTAANTYSSHGSKHGVQVAGPRIYPIKVRASLISAPPSHGKLWSKGVFLGCSLSQKRWSSVAV